MKEYMITKLIKWKSEGGKIAIYCAGQHGKSFKKLLDYLGIAIDIFLDNDENKRNTIIEGVRCSFPSEISGNNHFLTIICTNIDFYTGVYRSAQKQRIANIVDYREILDDLIENKSDVFLELIRVRHSEPSADIFYSNIDGATYEAKKNPFEHKERIAVYTGVFGNYDRYLEPLVKPDNIDYYYISENKPDVDTKCTWIDSHSIVPTEIESPIKQNRYIKMHPHLIFPNYKYSLYFDANIQIVGDVSELFHDSCYGIAVPHHWRRDCLYYEAMTVSNYKRVDPNDVIRQIRRYIVEGFPLHYGLAELCIIAREHNNPKCIDVMNTWWNEFNNESQRDQLSFPYALWKNDILLKEIALLGNKIRACDCFAFFEHLTDSENIHNSKTR